MGTFIHPTKKRWRRTQEEGMTTTTMANERNEGEQEENRKLFIWAHGQRDVLKIVVLVPKIEETRWKFMG